MRAERRPHEEAHGAAARPEPGEPGRWALVFKQHGAAAPPAGSPSSSAPLFQLDVLEYIHENEYVHADIKAANLMLAYRDPEQVSPGRALLILQA